MRLWVAMALVAGGAAQDVARDAGDTTHSLVRAELSYTRAGAQLRGDARAIFVRFRAPDPAPPAAPLGVARLGQGPLDESFEPISIEVRSGARGIRCRARDDGEFAVAAELVAALSPGPKTVTATRIARAPLHATGAGAGELSFALRDLQVLP